ncbi:unnamed protein product [Leptosia nina]|uniref:Uncharacterized protein n=1 Tax=Leptosia nina TaxID=320188 RepID=A0AAV1J3G1_9NEOP
MGPGTSFSCPFLPALEELLSAADTADGDVRSVPPLPVLLNKRGMRLKIFDIIRVISGDALVTFVVFVVVEICFIPVTMKSVVSRFLTDIVDLIFTCVASVVYEDELNYILDEVC